MAIFILVHGTWAKHARWTLPGSLLRTHIEARVNEAGHLASFESVPWGGHNFGRSRLAAAHAIAKRVKRAHFAHDHEQIFLIGHSHGGSAIAYFLKHYPDLAACVTGAAFLSTPFVATRVRPRCTSFLNSLLLSLGIMFIIITVGLTWGSLFELSLGVLFFFGSGFVLALPLLLFIWSLVTAVMPLLVLDFLLSRLKAALLSYITHYLPERLRRLDTTNIPQGNYVYLRAMGDEAAGILSVAHFFSWLISTTAALATAPAESIANLGSWVLRKRGGKVAAVILSICFAAWAVFANFEISISD